MVPASNSQAYTQLPTAGWSFTLDSVCTEHETHNYDQIKNK